MIELTHDPDRPGTLTDGRHTFFKCITTPRWRWAESHFHDDGLGIAGHGAASTLEEARTAAQASAEIREAIK